MVVKDVWYGDADITEIRIAKLKVYKNSGILSLHWIETTEAIFEVVSAIDMGTSLVWLSKVSTKCSLSIL